MSAMSTVLRKAKWILPSAAASVNFCPSSGFTNIVTTGAVCGFPFSVCNCCPTANTRTCSKMVRVIDPPGRRTGYQDVHNSSGSHKACHGYNVVNAHGNCAHSFRNGYRQTRSCVLRFANS